MSYTQVQTRTTDDANSHADINQLQLNIEALKGGLAASTPVTTIDDLNTWKTDFVDDFSANVKTELNATGTAPIYACRAWVNFNGKPLTGTYTGQNYEIHVTITNHGLAVGSKVHLTPTSGTASNEIYTVTYVHNANEYDCTCTTFLPTYTTGNITQNAYIRASGNVSSVTDEGINDYTINFATPMEDVNYVCLSNSESVAGTNNQWRGTLRLQGTKTINSVRLHEILLVADFVYCDVAVFR